MDKNIENKKRLLKEIRSLLLTSSLVVSSLSGCAKVNKENNLSQNTTQSTQIVTEATSELTSESTTENTTISTEATTVENTTEMTTMETTTEVTIVENTTETTTELTTEEATTEATTMETTTEVEQSKDDQVINELKNDQDELQDAYDNHDTESLASKGKKYFIKAVDFIFYDGEIKGVKFDELKEESKQVIYEQLCDMDELIMTLAPNYKETISEKYQIVKDFTKKGYYFVLDKIKDALGEERYDKIAEIKDNLKDKIGDLYEGGKTKIKDWYEEFKNK